MSLQEVRELLDIEPSSECGESDAIQFLCGFMGAYHIDDFKSSDVDFNQDQWLDENRDDMFELLFDSIDDTEQQAESRCELITLLHEGLVLYERDSLPELEPIVSCKLVTFFGDESVRARIRNAYIMMTFHDQLPTFTVHEKDYSDWDDNHYGGTLVSKAINSSNQDEAPGQNNKVMLLTELLKVIRRINELDPENVTIDTSDYEKTLSDLIADPDGNGIGPDDITQQLSTITKQVDQQLNKEYIANSTRKELNFLKRFINALIDFFHIKPEKKYQSSTAMLVNELNAKSNDLQGQLELDTPDSDERQDEVSSEDLSGSDEDVYDTKEVSENSFDSNEFEEIDLNDEPGGPGTLGKS